MTLAPVWIAGPPDRRQEALDAQNAYFRANPTHTDREWLQQAIGHLATTPATANLVGPHSMLQSVSPSGQAATALLTFWRDRDETGGLRHDLADSTLSTRFLGDLYQDLSEHAREAFALLQTPEFVEEFILDQTMEPALAERPIEGFRLIDPACGSGHFLLGAFHRLIRRWERHAPGLAIRSRVQNCLDAIHGVDLNPFAVAITHFRLLLAALHASGEISLDGAPAFSVHVETGDSLLHGHAETQLDFSDTGSSGAVSFTYETENLSALQRILHPGSYDVVVGNPPYITARDKSLNNIYRALYRSCAGKYSLTIPFMELFYSLAKPQRSGQRAGWTGQITSNSFMKRGFGKKIIEDFLVEKDLVRVVDTSVAYIPGHGTPTVILVGRNQRPVSSTVRAVLGIRGEPGRPDAPAQGVVWTSIIEHLNTPGHEDPWISVVDFERSVLAKHPWSLTGGGADQLLATVENAASRVLGDVVAEVGISAVTGQDDFYLSVPAGVRRSEWPSMPFVEGEIVRDWRLGTPTPAAWPYDADWNVRPLGELGSLGRALRTFKPVLDKRKRFGTPMVQRGLTWYEWQELYVGKLRVPRSITFPFVASHNHFAFDRGGKVFNRTAQVIKLAPTATEDDHVRLLAVLNSSTACFWLKQNSYPKGGDPVGQDGARVSQQPWSDRYEFTATTVQNFPLPAELPADRGRTLDQLATELSSRLPETVCRVGAPDAATIADAQSQAEATQRRMISAQEELDWAVYRLYGLVQADLTYSGSDLPELLPGERAFEIAMARALSDDEGAAEWFTRHGSTPITALPERWPAGYRALVQKRLDLIESDRFIRVLESPNYKRRWSLLPWSEMREAALRQWLLTRLESRELWHDRQGRPAPLSVGEIADRVARDPDVVSVLALWEGRPDIPVVQSLGRLIGDECVPFLAALRLKDAGLRKREAWEAAWTKQRSEDDAGHAVSIPAPPRFVPADFRKLSYWQARGSLDIPRERFVLYPNAGRATDPTMLIGWAGWDHAQQALALGTIIAARESDGVGDDVLIPLVAGLAELQPWVDQWHSEIDPAYGVSLAAFCAEQLTERARQVGRSLDQLKQWRPPVSSRGRRPRS